MSQILNVPWGVSEHTGMLIDCNGKSVIGSPEVQQRIAACVNACNGIPQKGLDAGMAVAGLLLELAEEQGQRGQLLAALKYCRDVFDGYVSIHLDKTPPDYEKAARNEKCRAVCDAAIAAVEAP